MLHGVNLFADYEQHEHGDFYRYGIGGEVRHEHVAFAANYYIPLTDDIRINNTEVAYSREGYDANLQVAIPGARYLKAEAAFYHFDGRHDNAADKGFRYGAALSPANGILLKLFYDNGGEEFGGALSWRYNFHPAQEGPQVHHNTPRMSSADLFAPVLREHSQRITIAKTPTASVTMTLRAVSLRITPLMTMAAVTTTMTTETEMVVPSRAASVELSILVRPQPSIPNNYIAGTLNFPVLLTLPPDYTHPLMSVINFNLFGLVTEAQQQGIWRGAANAGLVIITSNIFAPGSAHSSFPNAVTLYTVLVVQGSEEFISVTTTLTTRTTTTMAAMTTFATMSLTTFVTVTTTPGANAAINTSGKMPPMDSRLRVPLRQVIMRCRRGFGGG